MLCAPAIARAHWVSDELTAGSTTSTGTNLRSGSVADLLTGKIELSDAWSLKLSAGLTHDEATPPAAGTTFGSSGGNTLALSARGEFDPSERWAIILGGDYSPPSTTLADAPLSYTLKNGMTQSVDAQLSSHGWSGGGMASFGFDSNGTSPFEGTATAKLAFNWLSTTQQYTSFETRNGPLPASELMTYCATHKCPKAWVSSLAAVPEAFGQIKLEGDLVATLWQSLDVELDGAYYLYTQDPTQVGYWSIATSGRTTASAGGGAPVAPFVFTVTPSLIFHKGPIAIETDFRYGSYDGGGYDLQLTLRVDVKIGKHVKLWLSGQGQRDIESDGSESKAAYAALGARVKW